MKKILFIIALVISMVANAQNDTTIVKKDVRFDKETYTSKSGDTKEYYYAYIGDECYSSNKTSYERYKPTYALITNKKGKRIIIL